MGYSRDTCKKGYRQHFDVKPTLRHFLVGKSEKILLLTSPLKVVHPVKKGITFRDVLRDRNNRFFDY